MLIKNKKWKNLILLNLIVLIIILLFEIIPRGIELGSLFFDLIAQSNQIDEIQTIDNSINELKLINNKIKNQIRQNVTDYKENENISSFYALLTIIAEQTNSSIKTINASEIKKVNNLWSQKLEITFETNFINFFNFIQELENSQKVILIKNIFIKQEKLLSNKLLITTNFEVYLNL
ncbi:MAG: hypothetical protein JXA68_04780 [Ignavibacteriales bacterium]|nr:hypothetical protein [Ignavibacteriales bacterium]